MELETFQIEERVFARLQGEGIVISKPEDGSDLVGNAWFAGAEGIIVKKEQLSPDFFDLKTGLAGEILQKFSTYRLKIAITGDFSNIESKSLRDFIFESNKGKSVSFVETEFEAIQKLTSA